MRDVSVMVLLTLPLFTPTPVGFFNVLDNWQYVLTVFSQIVIFSDGRIVIVFYA